MTPSEIRSRLFAVQDTKYGEFQQKLMPTVDPARVIGVRMPELRRFAAEIARNADTAAFLADLPHGYYDEDNLHGILISRIRDFSAAVDCLDAFLPYVDNWATCDIIRPKAFDKHPELLPPQIIRWIESGRTYTVRFGIEMAMTFFLDDCFDPTLAEQIAELRSGEYYVNMMIAWYFATALAKQWDAVIPVIEQNRLDPWVHNKTIQKATESYRITAEQKAYLRTLKVGRE